MLAGGGRQAGRGEGRGGRGELRLLLKVRLKQGPQAERSPGVEGGRGGCVTITQVPREGGGFKLGSDQSEASAMFVFQPRQPGPSGVQMISSPEPSAPKQMKGQ